jgi:hypothetical protein
MTCAEPRCPRSRPVRDPTTCIVHAGMDVWAGTHGEMVSFLCEGLGGYCVGAVLDVEASVDCMACLACPFWYAYVSNVDAWAAYGC